MVTANILKASEQIGWLTIVLGLVSVALLTYGWWGVRRTIGILLAVDLATIFLYTWSLGSPSGVPVMVRQTASGITATVDGNIFTQPGAHAERVGLYSPAQAEYITSSNGGVAATGPIAAFANAIRFAVPGSGWTNIVSSDRPGGPQFGSFILTKPGDAWSVNPRGEIVGKPGAILWLRTFPPRSHFHLSATLMRPDGTQGVLLTDRSGRNGFLLAIRMDHRDARFYFWHNGQIGNCTCKHPQLFPVAFTPMLQRVLRFFLPEHDSRNGPDPYGLGGVHTPSVYRGPVPAPESTGAR